MSGKPQKQQQQQGKRKADAPAGGQQGKKAKEAAPAAAAAAPAPKQQQGKKPQQQQQQQGQGKKGKKAPEPEPEPEEEDEDEDDASQGEPDEEALKLIEAVQDDMDKITEELDQIEQKQQVEIFAIQKKTLLAKRPLLAKRDKLLAEKLPKMWKTLITEHETFIAQLEDVDRAILDHLTTVEIIETYTPPSAPSQQIVSVSFFFTFSAGSELVKAGRYEKVFRFNDEKENLECVKAPKMPFVDAAKFAKEHQDSFFQAWFASEGEDDGVLAAQDALSSELYQDPLQLYTHVAQGGDLSELGQGGMDSDDEAQMMFEEDDSDDEAPQLADE